MDDIDTQVIVFVDDPKICFDDSVRISAKHGLAIVAIPNRKLAENVLEMYEAERGSDALPLMIANRKDLSIVHSTLADRELERIDRIASFLGCEDYGTNDPVFQRVAVCFKDLSRLSNELGPLVEQRESRRRAKVTTHTPSRSTSDDADPLSQLLQAVETHRLLFLYFAAARRTNPLAIRSRSGVNERVLRDEIRGWNTMVEAIDSEGEFLWTHRTVLDKYAQAAVAEYGPGQGFQPTQIDEVGNVIPVKGATFPFWSLDDDSERYLEPSSDAVLNACHKLAKFDASKQCEPLLREAIRIARPDGHSRWNASIVIEWSYLGQLDDVLARIKTIRVELAMSQPSTTSSDVANDVKPDQQKVADLVILLYLGCDLHSIGWAYPEVKSTPEYGSLLSDITSRSNAIASLPGFAGMKTVIDSSLFAGQEPSASYELLKCAALTYHSSIIKLSSDPEVVQKMVQQALQECQGRASPEIRELQSRINNLKVISCRCPARSAAPEYAEPARFFQMLCRYWCLARDLVMTQMNTQAGFAPHPLLPMIENLRDRITTCFSHLTHLDDAAEIQLLCDQLVGMLTEGDLGDLSAVPEWTNGELQKVERFIARARMEIGAREYTLTTAEDFFITHCNRLIIDHGREVRAVWNQILARVDAKAATRSKSDTAKSAPTPRDETTHAKKQNARTEQIRSLLAALVEVDERSMSLNGRVESLPVRGKDAKTGTLIRNVQDQLHKWIDPILKTLKSAEKLSNGIGPLLTGFVSEPGTWEVETRQAIRSTRDSLSSLISSCGGKNEEAVANGCAIALTKRGTHLQAMHEAILAAVEAKILLAKDDSSAEHSSAPLQTPLTPTHTQPATSATQIHSASIQNSKKGVAESLQRLLDRQNETEQAILQAMLEHRVEGIDAPKLPSQETISKWAGYKWDTTFKIALAGLVKAGFLDNACYHGRRGGYFLTPNGKVAAEFLISHD